MRNYFGKWITKQATLDDKIILLVGDIGFGIFDEFKRKFPDRYYNVGICEQSMVSMAAGLALAGMKPYVYTITPFLIERAFEQVKVDIDAMNLNVKLIGYADYPEQGITHREVLKPDILNKIFSNLKSYEPKSELHAGVVLDKSYQRGEPTFISLKQAKWG